MFSAAQGICVAACRCPVDPCFTCLCPALGWVPATPAVTSKVLLLVFSMLKLRPAVPSAVEQWGPWFLVSLFAGILVWEEVWHLPDSAALSAWLLLLITAGAVSCSW